MEVEYSLTCVSDATKLMVYANSNQDSAFSDLSNPQNHNNAFFADEKLHCIGIALTVPLREAKIQTVTVTQTNVMPTLSVNPVGSTDMYVSIKVGAQSLAPGDIPGLKIYPKPGTNPTVYLSASDFTGFKMNTNSANYQLIASWSGTTATSDMWTGSVSVTNAATETTSYIAMLTIVLPNYSNLVLRTDWNGFTYVGSGTISAGTASSKFNSLYFDATPPTTYDYKYDSTIFSVSSSTIQSQLTAKLHITLLNDIKDPSISIGSTAMTKLDNKNFIYDFGSTQVSQDVTLTIKNGSQSKTIKVFATFDCAAAAPIQLLQIDPPAACKNEQIVLAPNFTAYNYRFNFNLAFATQSTVDTCFRALITLKVNSQTIVNETTDSCIVSGYISDVQEFNVIYWQVDVPKSSINLPYYKVTNGTVKVTSAVLYQAALTAGYTIKVDDTVHSLTAGEVAAIIVGSSLGLLMVVTAVVTYFCTHECLWVKDLPVKKIVMVDAYQTRPAQEVQEFYNAPAPFMAQ